jgi:hypothetical protein
MRGVDFYLLGDKNRRKKPLLQTVTNIFASTLDSAKKFLTLETSTTATHESTV